MLINDILVFKNLVVKIVGVLFYELVVVVYCSWEWKFKKRVNFFKIIEKYWNLDGCNVCSNVWIGNICIFWWFLDELFLSMNVRLMWGKVKGVCSVYVVFLFIYDEFSKFCNF